VTTSSPTSTDVFVFKYFIKLNFSLVVVFKILLAVIATVIVVIFFFFPLVVLIKIKFAKQILQVGLTGRFKMLFKSQELVLELAVEGFNLVDVVGLNLAQQVFFWNVQALVSSLLNSY